MLLNQKTIFKYFSNNITARHLLNLNNVEYISFEKLKNIGKLFDPDFFSIYKKRLFWKWNQKNHKNSESYLKRLNRLAKKLDLNFYDYEKDILYLLEAKAFTKFRTLKTLETPYKNPNMSKYTYFSYTNVYFYEYRKYWLKEKYCAELAISSKEMVFFDRANAEIIDFYKSKDIEKIELKQYGLIIYLVNNKKFLIRYLDNEIIFISFMRIWKKNFLQAKKKNL